MDLIPQLYVSVSTPRLIVNCVRVEYRFMQASEVSETLSGVYKLELMRYVYIYIYIYIYICMEVRVP